MAARHGLAVIIFSNGGLRPSANPLLRHVIVAEGAPPTIASPMPSRLVISASPPTFSLAARCLDKKASVPAPNGKPFTQESIGMALGMRELNRHLREVMGGQTHHVGSGKQNRSRFLNALENCIVALKRER